jgi:hypothetical protein
MTSASKCNYRVKKKMQLLKIPQVRKMVRVTENWLEPQVNGRGLFSYLWDQIELSFFLNSIYLFIESIKKYKFSLNSL